MNVKKEVISYLFFGILTTVVSVVTYQGFCFLLGDDSYLISNVISWIIAVTFAFVTNKLWVFESKSWELKVIKPQIISFLGARLFSLLLEEAGLYLMIDIMGFRNIALKVVGFAVTGTLIAKFIMQFIVVVTNYVFSKFLIFKKKED